MNANAVNRLIAYKRKLVILNLLENQQLNISEISDKICESFVIIKSEVQKLHLHGYLSRKKIYDPIARKRVFSYIRTNKKFPEANIKATTEQQVRADMVDFYNDQSRKKKPEELPKQFNEHQRIVVDPKTPHITTYLNLGRPGSDYAWQRSKSDKVNRGIGSTFAIFDSAVGPL
jgi:hypothetical protein